MSRSGKSQTGQENARAASSWPSVRLTIVQQRRSARIAARARKAQAARTGATVQRAPPASSTLSSAQNSGYCRTEAAKPAGSSARMVRAQRSSWRNSAASVVFGDRGQRHGAGQRDAQAQGARCGGRARCRRRGGRPGRARPPIRSRSRRRRHMVAPRQSCRPMAAGQQRAGQEGVGDLAWRRARAARVPAGAGRPA